MRSIGVEHSDRRGRDDETHRGRDECLSDRALWTRCDRRQRDQLVWLEMREHLRAAWSTFSEDYDVLLFARNVGRVADRLLWQKERRTAADATLGLRSKLVVQNIIGSSAALAGLFQQLSVVAPMNVGVLLTHR
jgi:hypothetical protein